MYSRRRVDLIFLALLGVFVGVPTWRIMRQEQLNRNLIAAVNRSDLASAVSLLQQGADANARDESYDRPEKAGSLLQMIREYFYGRRRPASILPSALILAVKPPAQYYVGDLALAKALLKAGANPNLVDREGVTALRYAEEEDNREMVSLLKQAGAKE